MDEMRKYLRSTDTIDCDNESIKAKAQSLTRGQEGNIAKAKNLFYFVRDEIKYNLYVHTDRPEHYRASTTLERGNGFCVQKAVLLAALARSVGIPARLHIVAIRNQLIPPKVKQLMGGDLFPAHGYDELYINDKWVKATAAFDIQMCQQNRLIPVEFDGESDAVFHSHNLDGKPHIEYVKDHGHYDDLPFEMITNLRIEALGADIFDRLRNMIETRESH